MSSPGLVPAGEQLLAGGSMFGPKVSHGHVGRLCGKGFHEPAVYDEAQHSVWLRAPEMDGPSVGAAMCHDVVESLPLCFGDAVSAILDHRVASLERVTPDLTHVLNHVITYKSL